MFTSLWALAKRAFVSTSKKELHRVTAELAAALERIKNLREENEQKAVVIAELSIQAMSGNATVPRVVPKPVPPHVYAACIYELRVELLKERKKNERLRDKLYHPSPGAPQVWEP